MPWEYKSANQRDREITISLENADDPDNVQVKRYTWTNDDNPVMTKTQFRKMVKSEVTAMLAELNSTPVQTDVTGQYRP